MDTKHKIKDTIKKRKKEKGESAGATFEIPNC